MAVILSQQRCSGHVLCSKGFEVEGSYLTLDAEGLIHVLYSASIRLKVLFQLSL